MRQYFTQQYKADVFVLRLLSHVLTIICVSPPPASLFSCRNIATDDCATSKKRNRSENFFPSQTKTAAIYIA